MGNTENTAKILLLGKTGVGKSSFINYFLGKDVAETGNGRPVTREITSYDYVVDGKYPIEIFDSKGIEALSANEQKKGIIDEVKKRNISDDVFNWFHTVFYCTSVVTKFEDFETGFIKELHDEISQHIHIILTNCDKVEPSVVQKMRDTIKKKLGDEGVEIFEVVSINGKLRDGTIVEQRGKEALSERVFDLLLEDIAYRVSTQYAKELHSAYIDVADTALKKAKSITNKTINLKNLIKMINGNDEIYPEDLFNEASAKVTGNLHTVQESIDKKFNQIMEPISKLYFSYKGIVETGSFVENANLLFNDTLKWVDFDFSRINVDELLKRATPNLEKMGIIDGTADADGNFWETLKLIVVGLGDMTKLKSRLKKFFKEMHAAFIKCIPSEEEIQKRAFDRIVEVMKSEDTGV